MLSNYIRDNISKSSWIRAMFEEGGKLRAQYGAENVFDFSLGNPDYEPPEAVKNNLLRIMTDGSTGNHRYMNNAGYPATREKIADMLSRESGMQFAMNDIIMTSGAAGGLNVMLKTILNPDDEVVVFSPYFVEYLFYIQNHGGTPVIVPTKLETFEPDLKALAARVTSKCKAVIINSPNNPTGVVYSKETLAGMSKVLSDAQERYGTKILVISDEPYNKIVYDGVQVPNIFSFFNHSVVVNSFSKSLAVPGERIGYIALNPTMKGKDVLLEGLVFANRTLGYVNAPSLFQKVIADSLHEEFNTSAFMEKRDFLYENLTRLGFSCVKPQGAFYLFPKSLIDDDIAFTKHALKYNLLLVPGSGFGCPGYFRLAYCVDIEVIKKSIGAFNLLTEDYAK